MKFYATRITQGKDLKDAIANFAINNDLKSGAVVSAVGSLSAVTIRMAGASPDKQDIRTYNGVFEIVSITGTIAQEGKAHIHISFANEEGAVIGGHLKNGCIVHTTVELVLVSDAAVQFTRELDETTGFDELKISAQ